MITPQPLCVFLFLAVFGLLTPGRLIAQPAVATASRVVEVEVPAPALADNLLGTPAVQHGAKGNEVGRVSAAILAAHRAVAVEEVLEKAVPPHYLLHAHHWLILHGRYLCKARKPDCAVCLVSDLCTYKAKTTAQ